MSGLLLIVGRSLRRHRLSTAITALSTALATGLVMAVFAVSQQARLAFAGGDLGFDAVLGARGSQVQLVLNAVFHLETSPGNVPWSLYQELREDPRVEMALPYAVGDSYRGHRVVGTTTELFTEVLDAEERPLALQPGSRPFDAGRREAVLGSRVARETGLRPGSHFQPSHGVEENPIEEHVHEEEYVVVGVLEPTGTPTDRVVWIPLEGVWRMDGHRLRGGGEEYTPEDGVAIPDEHKELSAVLLRLTSPQAGFSLANQVNRMGKEATLAWPVGATMAQLFDKLGWMARLLELVAYLVVVVAAGSILASLYNTMNERQREFAVLRSLGARRATVFTVIVLEAEAVALLGCAGGYLVFGLILAGAASLVRERTGVVLDPWAWHPALLWTPVGMAGLGALAGLLPALRAYSTDVARTLAQGS
jgi:putative ABC transport system permease protein